MIENLLDLAPNGHWWAGLLRRPSRAQRRQGPWRHHLHGRRQRCHPPRHQPWMDHPPWFRRWRFFRLIFIPLSLFLLLSWSATLIFRSFSIHIRSPDLELSGGRGGEQPVHRIFADPGGSHCIATVLHPGGAETYYTHAKWGRPRPITRLKGLVVNAVAWNRQQITEGASKLRCIWFFIRKVLPYCIAFGFSFIAKMLLYFSFNEGDYSWDWEWADVWDGSWWGRQEGEVCEGFVWAEWAPRSHYRLAGFLGLWICAFFLFLIWFILACLMLVVWFLICRWKQLLLVMQQGTMWWPSHQRGCIHSLALDL